MGKFKQAIHIEGKSIEDIFFLPCIYAIQKQEDTYCYLLTTGECAYVGDWLCQDYEDRWHILSDL